MGDRDVECPYCGAGEDICHDDGYGYEEGRTYQQECGSCGKTFTYTTSISFYHDAEKAPCLNGEKHGFEQIHGAPRSYFKGRYRCKWCAEEMTNKEEHEAGLKEYRAELESKPNP